MANISTRSMSKSERIKFWTDHITLWKKSSLTQNEYCRQNNINHEVFARWKKKKLLQHKKDSGFIEIPVSRNNLSKDPIEIIVNDTIRIKINDNYNRDLLQSVFTLLGIKIDN